MADIFHHFPIDASPQQVFQAITTPAGLDTWWTLNSSGIPTEGTEYELGFGPGYTWSALVTKGVVDREFELEMTSADADWKGSRIGFHLEERDGMTHVRFHHTDWPHSNSHFRTSSFCWAMYLRLLKRYVEHGEIVAYEDRLNA